MLSRHLRQEQERWRTEEGYVEVDFAVVVVAAVVAACGVVVVVVTAVARRPRAS